MKKELKNDKKTAEYLGTLPKIYLVGCWARYGVLEFFLADWEKENGDMIPLVYYYDDKNGTSDTYVLTDIRNTTTGNIIVWTTNRNAAYTIADKLNG